VTNLATLSGDGLLVDFERVGDRIKNTISAVNGCHVTPLLASSEGVPDESWPASPAFQELHLEQRGPNLELALLVGMAGTSHWSASIAIDRAAKTIHFDIACRIKDAAARLGSAYEILAESVNQQTNLLQLASPYGGVCIRGEQTSFQCHEKRLAIVPVIPMPLVVPGTIRWQYFIQ